MNTLVSRKSSGFSLIEVLVAVLVLSIGLLGVAALQTNALKTNQSAVQRSQATMLAYFMMDAMRANKAAASAGSYDLGKTCAAPAGGTLVTNDQNAWINALKPNHQNNPTILSLGDSSDSTTCGEIACNSTTCNVKVYWDDSRATGGGSAQVIEIQSRL